MKQNKYDDAAFFAAYSAMARSKEGLEAAGEWPALRALLPDFAGKRVLDLGCGFGWHCRYARAMGAAAVIGVDLSEKMLERARAETDDEAIVYERGAIEDVAYADGAFDVVLSSLAFHYVADLAAAFANVHRMLAPGGAFVFSMEHPVFTARDEQDWYRGPDGELLHWPLDRYQDQGIRHARWLADDVVKYHRTFAAIINGLIDAGFRVDRVVEPEPPAEMIAERPGLADELRRPMFLLIAASR